MRGSMSGGLGMRPRSEPCLFELPTLPLRVSSICFVFVLNVQSFELIYVYNWDLTN